MDNVKEYNPVMNSRELCKYLNISVMTIRKYVKKGMPAVKLGNNFRFIKIDIDAWLRQHPAPGSSSIRTQRDIF